MLDIYVLVLKGKTLSQVFLATIDDSPFGINIEAGALIKCPEFILSQDKARKKFGFKPNGDYVFKVVDSDRSITESTVYVSPVPVDHIPQDEFASNFLEKTPV
jgi:hypothetical protein